MFVKGNHEIVIMFPVYSTAIIKETADAAWFLGSFKYSKKSKKSEEN